MMGCSKVGRGFSSKFSPIITLVATSMKSTPSVLETNGKDREARRLHSITWRENKIQDERSWWEPVTTMWIFSPPRASPQLGVSSCFSSLSLSSPLLPLFPSGFLSISISELWLSSIPFHNSIPTYCWQIDVNSELRQCHIPTEGPHWIATGHQIKV